MKNCVPSAVLQLHKHLDTYFFHVLFTIRSALPPPTKIPDRYTCLRNQWDQCDELDVAQVIFHDARREID